MLLAISSHQRCAVRQGQKYNRVFKMSMFYLLPMSTFWQLPKWKSTSGLPDFSWPKRTKLGKNISNGRKILQMVIKYTNIFHSKAIQNLPKIGIFGLKINYLATLVDITIEHCFLIHTCIQVKTNLTSLTTTTTIAYQWILSTNT
jgi:hypothetical protein